MSKLIMPGAFFALAGSVFLAVAGWLYWEDQRFAESATSAQGVVIENVRYFDDEGDELYRPIVEFRDSNGTAHQFSSNVSSSSPQFDVGETADILYDPREPENARIDGFMQRGLFPLLFGGFGLLAIAVGGGMVFSAIARRRTIAELRKSGVQIAAEVVSVKEDESVEVNDEHPWRVIAVAPHPRTGKRTRFKSDLLWEWPGDISEGDSVPVYVSRRKPKSYFVDVDNAAPAPFTATAQPSSGEDANGAGAGFGRRKPGFGRRPARA